MNDTSPAARGRTQDPANAAHRVAHDGTFYYFCDSCCAETFRKDLGAALARAAESAGVDA